MLKLLAFREMSSTRPRSRRGKFPKLSSAPHPVAGVSGEILAVDSRPLVERRLLRNAVAIHRERRSDVSLLLSFDSLRRLPSVERIKIELNQDVAVDLGSGDLGDLPSTLTRLVDPISWKWVTLWASSRAATPPLLAAQRPDCLASAGLPIEEIPWTDRPQQTVRPPAQRAAASRSLKAARTLESFSLSKSVLDEYAYLSLFAISVPR